MSENNIKYAHTSNDGPADAVRAETQGSYIKFRGHGLYQRDKAILRKERTQVGMEASVSAGVVLLHDEYRDIAITVPLKELTSVLNEALRIGMAVKGE